MDYTILAYSALSTIQRDAFFNFLKEARKETSQPANENMWDDNWTDKDNTLPYLLEYTSRFTTGGKYHVIFDKDKVIGCSGIYTSAFCKDLAIAGTRTWVAKNYRHLSIAREILLPAEKLWAVENKFKAIAICFNDYNKNIIKIWKRVRLGEKRTPRQSHHLFFNGVNEPEFPVIIQYTKQWIMYEKLDPTFDFDWLSIKEKSYQQH
jgi:hypothetical protein